MANDWKRILAFTWKWALAGEIFLFLNRFVFCLLFIDRREESGLLDVLFQFLLGFRFDLSTLPFLVLPVLFFSPLLLFHGRFATLILRIAVFLQIFAIGLANTVLIASTYNFDVNNKHVGWEFQAYLKDLPTLLSGVFEQSFITGVLYVSILPAALILAWYLAFVRFRPDHSVTPGLSRRLGLSALYEFLIIAIFSIAYRGGLQQSPLRPGDAMKGSSFVSAVPLNGIFTIIHDSADSIEFKKFYSDEENVQAVQKLLGGKFLSAQYPLLRYMPPVSTRKPNIVLVVLESFTGKFLEINGGDPRIAPNLNAMIKKGAYFRRFYASGGRSANGLFCMFAGLPDRAGRTILRSSQIQNRFGGLPSLLDQKGYRTFFVHGGDLKFDNLDTALPHLGFERSFGNTDLKNSGFYHNSAAWGYDDDDTFDMLLRQMRQEPGRPFFGVIFTSNTHHPYTIPADAPRLFGESEVERDFLNAYHYSDAALGRFMDRASRESFYKNTVFLFVADHTHHARLDYLQDRNIPFLIIDPAHPTPAIHDEIGSQLDILPTVLAVSGGDSYYAAMGRSLVSGGSGERFAFFAGGSNTDVIGWIEGSRLLIKWLISSQSILYTAEQPVNYQNLADLEKDRTEELLRKAQGFHQFARSLEKNNSIWPAERELSTIKKNQTTE